jgi:hypothetical protein
VSIREEDGVLDEDGVESCLLSEREEEADDLEGEVEESVGPQTVEKEEEDEEEEADGEALRARAAFFAFFSSRCSCFFFFC